MFVWLVGFFNVLVNNLAISRTGPKTILRDATHETERGDHDFCLSRSHESSVTTTFSSKTETNPHFHQQMNSNESFRDKDTLKYKQLLSSLTLLCFEFGTFRLTVNGFFFLILRRKNLVRSK